MTKRKETLAALFGRLSREPITSIYLILSADHKLSEKAAERIIKRIFPNGPNVFNFDQFHGDDQKASTILQIAETLPMMAPRRAIYVKNFDKMGTGDQAILASFADDPSPTTTMILTASKFSRGTVKTKWYKKLLKSSSVFRLGEINSNDARSYIRQTCSRLNLEVNYEAFELLHATVGTNLAQIEHTLEKLNLYLGKTDDRQVNMDDINAVVISDQQVSIFDLARELLSGNVYNALKIIRKLKLQNVDAFLILFALIRHFRVLILVRSVLDQGNSTTSDILPVVSSFNVREWILKKEYLPQARQLYQKTLQHIHDLITETDILFKSSGLKQDILIERLVISVCLSTQKQKHFQQ